MRKVKSNIVAATVGCLLLLGSALPGYCMGQLRRVLDKFPSAIEATNLPPSSPQPPVSDEPLVFDRWTVKSIWRERAPRKVMAVRTVNGLLVVSSYDGKSRTDSWLHIRLPEAWRQIYKGRDETLGPIGEYNGRLYFCAEKGQAILSVGADGSVQRHAKIPSEAVYNIYGTVWNNKPVFAGVGEGKTKAKIFDARSGAHLVTLPLSGLVAGLAEGPDGVLFAAHSWGETGVSSSLGKKNTFFVPASVAYSPIFGVVLGGMRSAEIAVLPVSFAESDRPTVLFDLGSSKVNRLVSFDGLVWFSAANPDVFGFIHPVTRKPVIIAKFTDEPKASSGEQFDTDIWPVSRDRVFLARKHPKGCEVYEAIAVRK